MSGLIDLAGVLAQLDRFIAAPNGRPSTVNLRPMGDIAANLGLTEGLQSGIGAAGVGRFVEHYLQHATRLHSAGFYAHQTAAPNPGSTLASLIDGSVSNPMAIFEMGPAAATIEYWLINHLLALVGWSAPPWPEARESGAIGGCAAGVLVHGGSLATLTALIAARTKVQPDVWANGNDPRLCLICAAGAHYAVQRAAGIMGLGRNQIIHAASDARGALTAEGVADALALAQVDGRKVIAVIATACSTSVGAFDPLRPIAAVCARFGVWLHVDAAHGGGLLISEALRGRLDGIELADSIVWDAHKMMRTGPLCTAVLFRDERASNAAFEQEASYLFHAKGLPGFDFLHRTVECTKAALGLRWYLALAWEGQAAVARYIESRVALTHATWRRLQADPDFETAIEPEANILCFRPIRARGQELQLRDELILEGEYHLSTTIFGGERWLRIVVMSPATNMDSIEALLERLRRLG
jgi:L-2,4-diaminobutyrate decarboxylase